MGNPRETHIDHIQLAQIALFQSAPAHMLPNEVYGSCSVKQHGADGADSRTERYRHCLSLSGCGIETHGMHGNHGKRNADVRDRANVSGNRAARRYQCDVYDLNGRAEINACLYVTHDEADDQTRYQRTAQCVVAEHRTAQTGHGCQTCEQSEQCSLPNLNLHKFSLFSFLFCEIEFSSRTDRGTSSSCRWRPP